MERFKDIIFKHKQNPGHLIDQTAIKRQFYVVSASRGKDHFTVNPISQWFE
jgi:hypothetical protein